MNALEAGKAPDAHPAVAAGGPYTAGEGAALSSTARRPARSIPRHGISTPTASFDDATG